MPGSKGTRMYGSEVIRRVARFIRADGLPHRPAIAAFLTGHKHRHCLVRPACLFLIALNISRSAPSTPQGGPVCVAIDEIVLLLHDLVEPFSRLALLALDFFDERAPRHLGVGRQYDFRACFCQTRIVVHVEGDPLHIVDVCRGSARYGMDRCFYLACLGPVALYF